MLKLSILTFILFFIVPGLANATARLSHVAWAESRDTEKDHSITALTFYFHALKNNETSIQVANAGGPDKSKTAFGSVVVADHPLTTTPDMKSKLIGRAHGFFASASMQETGLLMAFTFEFTDGNYRGSSFSVLGESLLHRPVREVPVIGGTGLFRFARGFTILRTHDYKTDGPSPTFIIGFNVTLVVPNSLKNIS